MEPVFTQALAVSALGLGDLILMVWEAEVDSAAMKFDGFTFEGSIDHGRALQVPARAAFAPWAFPVVVTVFRLAALPECKVGHGLAVILVGVIDFTGRVLALGL